MAGTKIDAQAFPRGLSPCPSCGHANPCDGQEPLSVFSCAKCGAPVICPLRIRSYWLYQPLGGGGMGSVYKAVQEGSGREFAVKVLPREGRANPDLIQAIQREGQAGAALGRHPHLVPVVETGCDQGEHFIVTEFATGERLDQMIERRGALPEKVAIEITRQLIEAEIHICRQGHLFRDMKPENIMYSAETDTVKLFDYGLCLPLAMVSGAHAAGDDLEGSPLYMPPERIVGAPEGEYSEVYSLGMLLFYMLTGRTYYSQADIEKLVAKHVSSLRVSSVGNRLQHCSPQLVPVLDRMIARSPNQRFPDLESLKSALEAAAAGLRKTGPIQVPAAKASATAPLPPVAAAIDPETRHRRQRRNLAVLGAILAVLVLLGGGLWLGHRHKVGKVRRLLQAETAESLGVAADVRRPAMPVDEVERLAAQRTEERFAERARAIADFDEKAAEKAICESLGIGALRRRPAKAIAELDAEIRRGIDTEAEREIARATPPFPEQAERERIAREMGVRMPLPAATESAETVAKALQEEVAAAIAEEFPSRLLTERIKMAMNENRAYRLGEEVTLQDQLDFSVTGRYQGREGNKIAIGDRKLLISDLPAGILWRFDDNLAQARTARAVEAVRDAFQKERQDRAQQLLRERERAFHLARGLIQDGNSWRNPAIAIEEKVAQARAAHAARQEAARREIRDRIAKSFDRNAILKDHGYVQVGPTWLPQDQAVKTLLDKRREEFTRQRQAQLARILNDTEKEVRDETFREQGYVWMDNRWQEARSLIDQIVARDLERRLAMP